MDAEKPGTDEGSGAAGKNCQPSKVGGLRRQHELRRLQEEPMARRHMFTEAPGISTCSKNGHKGKLTERTYDYVVASESLQGKI